MGDKVGRLLERRDAGGVEAGLATRYERSEDRFDAVSCPLEGRLRHRRRGHLAVRRKGGADGEIVKQATPQVFCHSFATHLLDSGSDVRQVQTLLGHEKLETTMIYTHLTRRAAVVVTGLLDRLE